MSLKTEMRVCMKCRRPYFWNPDVGKWSCPYCNRKLAAAGKRHFNRKNKRT